MKKTKKSTNTKKTAVAGQAQKLKEASKLAEQFTTSKLTCRETPGELPPERFKELAGALMRSVCTLCSFEANCPGSDCDGIMAATGFARILRMAADRVRHDADRDGEIGCPVPLLVASINGGIVAERTGAKVADKFSDHDAKVGTLTS